jgi:hypothetical protein
MRAKEKVTSCLRIQHSIVILGCCHLDHVIQSLHGTTNSVIRKIPICHVQIQPTKQQRVSVQPYLASHKLHSPTYRCYSGHNGGSHQHPQTEAISTLCHCNGCLLRSNSTNEAAACECTLVFSITHRTSRSPTYRCYSGRDGGGHQHPQTEAIRNGIPENAQKIQPQTGVCECC